MGNVKAICISEKRGVKSIVSKMQYLARNGGSKETRTVEIGIDR